jgi:hypothetical protein
MKPRVPGILLAASMVLTGCAQASNVRDKATVCTEALGLADLNPLVDPEKLKARAQDKERRLRELADNVSDRDLKNSLLSMAGSYVEVQQERFDDLTVVASWATRNTAHLDALRKACT